MQYPSGQLLYWSKKRFLSSGPIGGGLCRHGGKGSGRGRGRGRGRGTIRSAPWTWTLTLTSTTLSSSRSFTSSPARQTLQFVTTLPNWDLQTFRERAFIPKLPALLPKHVSKQLPASQSWLDTDGKGPTSRTLQYDYLRTYGSAIVPLELTQMNEAGTETFNRFNAPLQLFLDWMKTQQQEQATEANSSSPSAPRLYLAQCSISDLPPPLQADLPAPSLVLEAGKGDIYDSNIWIGTPPTYTPLHRDPNPNLFLQLAGSKVVRLFPPDEGREIYGRLQEQLGRSSGNPAFRGEEMMQGAERELLEEAVWGDQNSPSQESGSVGDRCYEAVVQEGTALFIPLGWWHSIKSGGSGITVSVNWWFR